VDNHLLDGFALKNVFIEPLTGEVSSPRGSAHLPPKSIEVLLLLCKHPRRLVTRTDILAKVWGDGRGSAETLSHAISEIRHALDDHAATPSFIQTVPTRGYRLLVEPVAKLRRGKTTEPKGLDTSATLLPKWDALVRHGVVQAAAAYLVVGWLLIQIADATFANLGLPPWAGQFVTFIVVGGFPVVIVLAWFVEFAKGRLIRDRGQHAGGLFGGLGRNYLAIIAAYGFAALGAGVYQVAVGFNVTQTDAAATPTSDLIPVMDQSLAVLQFRNIDGSETTQAFGDGLSEDLIDGLAKLPGLLVSSRSDSWSFDGKPSSEMIRRRLRVAYYLEGSVRSLGDRLRIVVQLIDSQSGFHVFSRSFDREILDIGDVQKEVTGLVVANLRIAIDGHEGDVNLFDVKESNVDAYVLYMRGRELLNRPRTAQSIAAASALFHDALEIDDDYPAAHAGLCTAHTALFELEHKPADIEIAQNACARALAVGPQLPVVINTVARLYRLTGKDRQAESMYQSALQKNEQDTTAMQGLARILQRQQRFDEAEALMQKAIQLRPGNWNGINLLGSMYFSVGRYADAADQYRKAVYLDPDNHLALGNLGGAYIMAGDFDAARIAIERSLAIEQNEAVYSNLGIIYYYLGDFERSAAIQRKVVEISPRSNAGWLGLGDALHFSRNPAAAQQAFQRSAELSEEQLLINPTDAEALTLLAWAKAMTGTMDEAVLHVNRAIEVDPADPYSHYFDGLIKLQNNQPDAAIDALATALEKGYPANLLAAEPYLKELQSDPGFANFLTKAGVRGEDR